VVIFIVSVSMNGSRARSRMEAVRVRMPLGKSPGSLVVRVGSVGAALNGEVLLAAAGEASLTPAAMTLCIDAGGQGKVRESWRTYPRIVEGRTRVASSGGKNTIRGCIPEVQGQ